MIAARVIALYLDTLEKAIVLGAMLGGAALLWSGNPYLGLVVGVSLAEIHWLL